MASLYVKAFAVPQMLPISLGFVAGFIDACTFLALFRLFVAQVTGSFVITGAQFVDAIPSMLIPATAIPIFFLIGVGTALLLTLSGRTGWIALTTGLAIETALVIAFLVIGTIGAPFARPNAPLAAAASLLGISAMSVQSTLVRLLMAGAPSTNVMTTNTTQLAIDAAEWLTASRRHRVNPGDLSAQTACAAARRRFTCLFSIMIAFLGGTICGALGYRWLGLACLLTAVVILAGIIGYCAWRSTSLTVEGSTGAT
jgi:uncharacterized membrane protein YoaK (UPF0700 family)